MDPELVNAVRDAAIGVVLILLAVYLYRRRQARRLRLLGLVGPSARSKFIWYGIFVGQPVLSGIFGVAMLVHALASFLAATE